MVGIVTHVAAFKLARIAAGKDPLNGLKETDLYNLIISYIKENGDFIPESEDTLYSADLGYDDEKDVYLTEMGSHTGTCDLRDMKF